jgi:pimeloyl-ACP methyl ester carboxylesterase
LRAFICDVPRTKLRQFIDWSLRGAFCSADGRIDYRANLRQINVPALVIAGAADRLATTDSVAAAFERIGSADKTWREFSAGNGDCADYGHVDLIFGTRAPEEVFRLIGTWLQERFDRSARA